MSPLTIDQKAARLHVECPWLTHSEIMRELSSRRRTGKTYGVLHPQNSDRVARNAVESPQYAWQLRADFQ